MIYYKRSLGRLSGVAYEYNCVKAVAFWKEAQGTQVVAVIYRDGVIFERRDFDGFYRVMYTFKGLLDYLNQFHPNRRIRLLPKL